MDELDFTTNQAIALLQEVVRFYHFEIPYGWTPDDKYCGFCREINGNHSSDCLRIRIISFLRQAVRDE